MINTKLLSILLALFAVSIDASAKTPVQCRPRPETAASTDESHRKPVQSVFPDALTSLDGTCGPGKARPYCPAGNCCSSYGYCGATSAHCGTGCKLEFGKCFEGSPSAPAAGSDIAPAPSQAPSTANSGDDNGNDSTGGSIVTQCKKPGVIALTLDDGPSEYTPEFLKLLKAEGAKATFFVVGSMVAENGAAMQQAYRDGHLIASHSYTHPDFTKLSPAQLEWEMKQTDSAIFRLIQKHPKYFRFPYGRSSPETVAAVQKLGYTPVRWSFDSNDWALRNTQKIVNNFSQLIRGLKINVPGDITLSHDTYPETLQALSTVIRQIKARGFKLVTVAECLGDSNPYQ